MTKTPRFSRLFKFPDTDLTFETRLPDKFDFSLVHSSINRPKHNACINCNSTIETSMYFRPRRRCENYLMDPSNVFGESLPWLKAQYPALRAHRSIRFATAIRPN